MHRYSLLMITLFGLASSAAQAGPDICGCWTPQAAQIVHLERQLQDSRQLAGKLTDYARRYAGGINGSRTFIRGQLVPLTAGEVSAVHVATGRMPPLQGAGCITGYDTKIARILYVACAAPGAWTPTRQDVATLEQRIVLADGTAPLNLFSRNYAGITRQGRKLIQAVLVRDDDNPGVHIASEAELPTFAEGGCMVIGLLYDAVSGQTLDAHCADGG
jgi:hypothetical protein